MKLCITIYQDEDGMLIAECPSIPGCISQGKTNKAFAMPSGSAVRFALNRVFP